MKKLKATTRVPVLQFDHDTHEFVPTMSAYDGPITEKAWRGINKKFLDDYAAGKFYPLGPEDAYQYAVHEAEKAAAKIADGLQLKKTCTPETYEIGAAKLRLLNFCARKVLPTREEHAAIEEGRICELRVRAPLHVRAEYALNFLSELCERILATDRQLGETIVLAFAAYICCDGNIVEASKLARISKNRWYRDWPIWCAWARAAARELPRAAGEGEGER